MSKKEKQVIEVLIGIAVIAIIVVLIVNGKNKEDENIVNNETVENNTVEEEKYVEVLENGTKLNTSEKLKETKEIDGMEISNMQLTEEGNITKLLGTITNNSNTTKGNYEINIKLIDENGKELTTLVGYIGELEPGESTQLSTSTTFDYANTYDVEITKR